MVFRLMYSMCSPLSRDLPADAICAYGSATANITTLAKVPAGTRTYVAVVIGRG